MDPYSSHPCCSRVNCTWVCTSDVFIFSVPVSTVCSLSLILRNFGGFFFFWVCLFIYLFIYWLCWVFVAECELSLLAASGGYSSLQCTGFSLRWLLLWSMGSRPPGFSSCGLRALEHRLSSCDTRA